MAPLAFGNKMLFNNKKAKKKNGENLGVNF